MAGDESARARTEGLLALVGVQLAFGLSPLFARWTLDSALNRAGAFAPRGLVAWRILFGATALGTLAALKYGRRALPARHELPRILLCSLLGVGLNMWLYLEGVARTSVTHAGLLVTLIPVFTYAIACLLRVERPARRRLLGIGVALAGALWVAFARASDGAVHGSATGNLLIVVNGLSYAVYLVFARTILQRHPTLVVIAWVFVGALAFVPLFFLGVPVWPAELHARAAVGFAYTLVFATFVAYLLNAYALARVAASTVALFINLQPLVAGAAGALLLGERPSASMLTGGLVLLAGLVLVVLERRGGTSESIQRVAGRVFHSRR